MFYFAINATVWGWGDPHINTLDNANYTFNGWGEYTLSRIGNFTLQGRTSPVNESDTTNSATQFAAFAFGFSNNYVEVSSLAPCILRTNKVSSCLQPLTQVRLENGSFVVLLNSADITDTVQNTGDSNSNSTLVFLERTSENSILTSFSNGIAVTVSESFGLLSFVSSIPEEFQGMPVGLLGNFNGDSSDDLIYPNGTQLDIDSSDRMIHDFGQSCT